MNLVIVLLLLSGYGVLSETARKQHGPNAVRINKCCEPNEILLDMRCSTVNSSICKYMFKRESTFLKTLKLCIWLY